LRPIRYITDLPWWVGLILFLIGNIIVPDHYLVGMPMCLFGAWTFSKLIKYDDYHEVGAAFIGFPVFFLVMLIPDQFTLETPVIDLLNEIPQKVNFTIRAALGMLISLIAFQGVRR